MQNMGSSWLLLLVAVVLVTYILLRPSKAKKEERANLSRIADALDEQAKDKKEWDLLHYLIYLIIKF